MSKVWAVLVNRDFTTSNVNVCKEGRVETLFIANTLKHKKMLFVTNPNCRKIVIFYFEYTYKKTGITQTNSVSFFICRNT